MTGVGIWSCRGCKRAEDEDGPLKHGTGQDKIICTDCQTIRRNKRQHLTCARWCERLHAEDTPGEPTDEKLELDHLLPRVRADRIENGRAKYMPGVFNQVFGEVPALVARKNRASTVSKGKDKIMPYTKWKQLNPFLEPHQMNVPLDMDDEVDPDTGNTVKVVIRMTCLFGSSAVLIISSLVNSVPRGAFGSVAS